MALPNFRAFQLKARQSEARTQLSALFTGEQSFFNEWGTYNGTFVRIGYAPSGVMRYLIGFDGSNRTPTGYSGPGGELTSDLAASSATAGSETNSEHFCTNNNCEDSSGSAVTITKLKAAAVSAKPTDSTFKAGAIAQLDSDTPLDTWTINEKKELANPVSDISQN